MRRLQALDENMDLQYQIQDIKLNYPRVKGEKQSDFFFFYLIWASTASNCKQFFTNTQIITQKSYRIYTINLVLQNRALGQL